MRNLNRKIIILNKEYNIDWSIGGDYAWLKTERGFDGCNSSNPYYRCIIPQKDFYKSNKEKINICLRSCKQSEEYMQNKKEKFGYVNTPIFDFIDFDKVHFDPLHEALRIPNLIFKLKYKMLIRIDNSNSKDFEKLVNQKKFSDFLTSIKN